MNRHGLSVRRKTTQSQKDPERLVDKLVHFVRNQDIIAMDETAVWLDMISGTTV